MRTPEAVGLWALGLVGCGDAPVAELTRVTAQAVGEVRELDPAHLVGRLLREPELGELRRAVASSRRVALSRSQLERLADAAHESDEPRRRTALLQVLATSGWQPGRELVLRRLLDGDEAEALALLDGLPGLGLEELPLLCGLYAGHPSELVQEALLRRVFTRHASGTERELQDAFALWLLEHRRRSGHLLAGLRTTIRRAGASRFGEDYAAQALARISEPELRAEIYMAGVERRAEVWLPRVLSGEPEQVVLAVLERLASQDRRMRLRGEGVAALKQAMLHDSSPGVRARAEALLRGMAHRHLESSVASLSRRCEEAAEHTGSRRASRYLLRELDAASIRNTIETRYGVRLEDEQLRARLEQESEVCRRRLAETAE